MMEAELLRLHLFPTEDRPAVDLERFIQGLEVRMDQHSKLDPSVLGMTEFYTDGPPKIFISSDLTNAIDDDETPPGIRGRWRATMAHAGENGAGKSTLAKPSASSTAVVVRIQQPHGNFRCVA
jgi:hypothetical protein